MHVDGGQNRMKIVLAITEMAGLLHQHPIEHQHYSAGFMYTFHLGHCSVSAVAYTYNVMLTAFTSLILNNLYVLFLQHEAVS
jgi:hypothetical protein